MILVRVSGLLSLIVKLSCFNLDTNCPIVYVDPYKHLSIPNNRSAYFGYSLILYPGNRRNSPWIQIGAPRGNSPHVDFYSPGAIFKCGIAELCQMIDVDTERQHVSTSSGQYINKLDGAWIGGSMDINYKYERVVTCGYRWTNYKKNSNRYHDDYRMLGACYWSHINDNTTQKLLPLLDSRRDIYTDKASQSSVYYYAQGQSGFSVHMPPGEKEMILGAPGVFNWDGTSILYRDADDDSPIASKFRLRHRLRRYADPEEFADVNVANALMTTQSLAYDLLGYSVTSGHFYKKKELLYVTSAPRSKKYLGQILIHKFYKGSDLALDVRESKQGTQFGEYFGGSLTAGDIDNDGYDDLIVGAPYYRGKKYNEGRIYVFLGSPKGTLQIPNQGKTIVGRGTNGQFGLCIQFLGDLNHDGFGDVAVAAPYEEDNIGVVYLFRGTRNGLDMTPCQRIIGTDISREIRGFGMSISRPADIDFNRYSDLAIGAYISGHAVLLRTRPTVTINHSLQPLVPRLDYTEKSLQVRACFWFSSDELDYAINITRNLVVDEQLGRASIRDDDSIKPIYLRPNKIDCENISIVLKDKFTNRDDPVTFSLSHQLITDDDRKEVVFVSDSVIGNDRFCPRCPVYDKFRSSQTSTVQVPFALGCGSDNVCDTNLEIESKFLNIGDDTTFILGSSSYLKLQTTVKNLGERAYSTLIVVNLPEAINFQQIPSFCVSQNTSALLCSIGNPLEESSQKTVELDLDMNNVNSGKYEDFLVVSLMVLTSSNNSRRNFQTLIIKLKREADITISGKSDQQSYSIGNMTNGKPNFTQTYQIQKIGLSPIDEVLIEINIPHAIAAETGETVDFVTLHPPIGFLAGQPINCKSNFTYIVSDKKSGDVTDSIVVDDNESSDNTTKLRRLLRQVEVFTNSSKKSEELVMGGSEFAQLQNRTFHINCSMPEVICSKVVCTSGPFESVQSIGVIDIKMLFDISIIEELLRGRDIVLLTTHGSVVIQRPSNFVQSGDRPDGVHVSSLFVGDSVEPKIATWIIIVSVIAGLLLLLLVILGLIKAGFFKRAKKEELQQLKQEMEYEATEASGPEPEEAEVEAKGLVG